ncbi:hypothetical protein ABZ863_01650 [Saccharomonospora sp. NPDC046836]
MDTTAEPRQDQHPSNEHAPPAPDPVVPAQRIDDDEFAPTIVRGRE